MRVEQKFFDYKLVVCEKSDGRLDFSLETMIICHCHSHAISLRSDDFGLVDLSFWNQGFNYNNTGFIDRIRLAWKVLTKGTYYTDMVILMPDECEDIAKFAKVTRFLSVGLGIQTPSNELEEQFKRHVELNRELQSVDAFLPEIEDYLKNLIE